MKRVFLLCLFSSLIILYVKSQTVFIDFSKIPQDKIKTLLQKYSEGGNQIHCSNLEPTYRKGQTLEGYRQLESLYLFHENPDKVWKTYKTTSPAESWNGNMISFGVLISKKEQKALYNDGKYFTGIDTGQVFYINLKLLKGLYNLAVGLQIVDVDSVNRSITYSYIKGGKSRGEQTLIFVPTKKGNTEILHLTSFKGDSFIRDRYLYPFFHRKLINEFHRNMKKSLYRQT